MPLMQTITKHIGLLKQWWIWYLIWQWIFYFLRRCFLSSNTAKTFTRFDYIYISNTVGVL